MPKLDTLEGITTKQLAEFNRYRGSISYLKADIDVPDEYLRAQRDKNYAAVNHEVIADICSRVFKKTPLSITPVSAWSTFHLLYEVMLPGAKRYIIRINAGGYPYLALHFYIDKWIMDTLKREKLPSLQVHHIDVSRKTYPFDYEILQQAKGELLNSFEIDEELDRNLMFELGTIMAKIHNIRTENFGLLDVGHIITNKRGRGLFQSWREFIFCNLQKHIDTCFSIGAVSLEEKKRIEGTFRDTDFLLDGITPSLLHGDLADHNTFTDGRLITAIIDWEDCMSGDRVYDIAMWGTFYRDERRERFLKGYRAVQQLSEDFELRYWLYYLRIALAKTVHRYRFNYPDRPGRPPASQRIQKAVEKIESLDWC